MKTIVVTFLLAIMVVRAAPINPESVAVLYNSNIPESKELAQYYAGLRHIPAANLIGLPLSEQGQINRETYNTSLREPLWKVFSHHNWWTLGRTSDGTILPTSCKITTSGLHAWCALQDPTSGPTTGTGKQGSEAAASLCQFQ